MKILIPWIVVLFGMTSPLFAIHTVILKKGEAIRGMVVGQNPEIVQIKTESGNTIEIPKRSILKVVYKEITQREEDEIRIREEAKQAALLKKLEEQRLQAEKEREAEIERKKKEREAELTSQTPYPSESVGFLTNYKVYKSYPRPLVTLASPDAVCKPFSQSSDWYILFGTIPLTRPNMAELLPSKSTSIQVRYESNWVDVTASILGSFLATVSRKTLVVETCEDPSQPKLLSEEEIKWEKDILRKQEEELRKEREKQELEETIKLEVELRKLEKTGVKR